MFKFLLILSFWTVLSHCSNKSMPSCNLYVQCEVLPITSIPKTGCIGQCIEELVMLSQPSTKNTNILLCKIKRKGHCRIIFPTLLCIQ